MKTDNTENVYSTVFLQGSFKVVVSRPCSVPKLQTDLRIESYSTLELIRKYYGVDVISALIYVSLSV